MQRLRKYCLRAGYTKDVIGQNASFISTSFETTHYGWKFYIYTIKNDVLCHLVTPRLGISPLWFSQCGVFAVLFKKECSVSYTCLDFRPLKGEPLRMRDTLHVCLMKVGTHCHFLNASLQLSQSPIKAKTSLIISQNGSVVLYAPHPLLANALHASFDTGCDPNYLCCHESSIVSCSLRLRVVNKCITITQCKQSCK